MNTTYDAFNCDVFYTSQSWKKLTNTTDIVTWIQMDFTKCLAILYKDYHDNSYKIEIAEDLFW